MLDALGIRMHLNEGQQVVDAMVIAKVVSFDGGGDTALLIASGVGLDWINQRGLLAAAGDLLVGDIVRACGGDD